MLVREWWKDKAADLLWIDPVQLDKRYVISRYQLIKLQYQVFFSPAKGFHIVNRVFSKDTADYDTGFGNLVRGLFREWD